MEQEFKKYIQENIDNRKNQTMYFNIKFEDSYFNNFGDRIKNKQIIIINEEDLQNINFLKKINDNLSDFVEYLYEGYIIEIYEKNTFLNYIENIIFGKKYILKVVKIDLL